MSRLNPIQAALPAPLLGGFLDNLIHPRRDRDSDPDPFKPFTPPPSQPSKEDDDDDDGPSFPMDPALA